MTNDDKLIGELAVFLYSLSPQRDTESELDRDLSFGEIDNNDQETIFSEAVLILEHLKRLNAFATPPQITPEVRERCIACVYEVIGNAILKEKTPKLDMEDFAEAVDAVLAELNIRVGSNNG